MHLRSRFLAPLLMAVLLLSLTPAAPAWAAPAYPGPAVLTEPATGQAVTVYNGGDEFFSYMTDEDGYVIEPVYGLFWYVCEEGDAYRLGAQVTGKARALDPGRIRPGAETDWASKLDALRTSLPQAAALAEDGFLTDIPAGYRMMSEAHDAAYGKVSYQSTQSLQTPEKEAACPLLVLRIQYGDLKSAFSDAQWHQRIFEDGVSDYYTAVSNGAFTYIPMQETGGTPDDGVITVTLPIHAPLWARDVPGNRNRNNGIMTGLYAGSDGRNYALYNESSLFLYGLLAAEKELPELSGYDRNHDGFLSPTELAVIVICTGLEASANGSFACLNQPAVWGHSWTANDLLRDDAEAGGQLAAEIKGCKLFKYTMMGEVDTGVMHLGNASFWEGAVQSQYGTACHELGHDLGLMDLYNVRDENASPRVDGLSLMGGGNWGAASTAAERGSCPTHLDPYSKQYLHFYAERAITQSGQYTLWAAESAGNYNILRIDTAAPGVYYLIENRQLTGFDRGLQSSYDGMAALGGGIVVWRIDDEALELYWSSNLVNCFEGYYGIMPVFQAQKPLQPFWGGSYYARKQTLWLEEASARLTFFPASSTEMQVAVALDTQPLAPVITTEALPDALVGEIYTASLAAQSDTPVRWSLAAGRLPDGISLDNGRLCGTAVTAETCTFTLKASNGLLPDVEKTLTLHVRDRVAPAIQTDTLTAATVGLPYWEYVAVSGGGDLSWSISGDLPEGILFADGEFSGIPSASGDYPLTLWVSNGVNPDASRSFTLVVADAPSAPVIHGDSDAVAYAGVPYSRQFYATGLRPIQWSVTSGALPEGLTLDGGVLSGVPAAEGSFWFTLRAKNSAGFDELPCVLNILPAPTAPSILTSGLADGIIGGYYAAKLTAEGGGNMVWTLAGGVLPRGLGLTDGSISGTAMETGTFPLTVKASNGVSPDATKTLTLRIVRAQTAPVFLTDTLPNATVAKAYNQRLAVSGGGSLVWAMVSGTLPPGLTFEDGVILGEPMQKGTFSFTLQASNGIGPDAIKQFTLTVDRAVYTISLLADPLDGGSVAGGGSFFMEETIPLTATASRGYRFMRWMETDPVTHEYLCEFASENPLQLYVYDNLWLTAIFEPYLSILTQPKNQTAYEGQRASFAVEASGEGLRYQWQADRQDGRGWQPLPGAVSSRYETAALTLSHNGYRYACTVTDAGGGQLTTSAATLYVQKLPPVPQTGDKGRPGLWLLLVLAGGAGLALTGLQGRKRPSSR